VPLLPFERRGAKLYLPGAVPSLAGRDEEAAALGQRLAEAGARATKVEDRELARYLEASGALVRLGDGYAIGAKAYAATKEALVAECQATGQITLARFRDLVGTGRRDAQLLLERFDRDGLTRRVGESRVLRRSAGGPAVSTTSS
jgi:selenocysteine-specific elongation factor